MDFKIIEEEIVKKYVVKNKQDRLLWEFRSAKKRKYIFWRFAGSEIFKESCLKKADHLTNVEIESYLLQSTGRNNVYFIGEDYIGELTLKKAMQKASIGEICIIYCGNGIGYYQGEENYAKTPRYFLIQ